MSSLRLNQFPFFLGNRLDLTFTINNKLNGATTKSLPEIYLSELKEIYGKQFEERYIFIQSDVSKADDRSKLVNLIKGKFNRIDVLALIPRPPCTDLIGLFSFSKLGLENLGNSKVFPMSAWTTIGRPLE